MDYWQFREKFLSGHFGITCKTVEERRAVVSWLHENEPDLFVKDYGAGEGGYTRKILHKTADFEFPNIIFLQQITPKAQFINYYRTGYSGATEEMNAEEFLNMVASESQSLIPRPIADLFS